VTPKPFDIPKILIWKAYKHVKANGGAAGVDQQTIEQFEEHLCGNLFKLWNRMCSGSYFPPPVRAVPIPNKTGSVRVLGVPTIADRVAQTVVEQWLEPKLDPHRRFSSNTLTEMLCHPKCKSDGGARSVDWGQSLGYSYKVGMNAVLYLPGRKASHCRSLSRRATWTGGFSREAVAGCNNERFHDVREALYLVHPGRFSQHFNDQRKRPSMAIRLGIVRESPPGPRGVTG